MKRIVIACIAGLLLAGMANAQTQTSPQSDSLGDYARTVRKDKKPVSARRYDNDTLPRTEKLSIVGNATDASGQTASTDQSASQSSGAASKTEKDEKKTKSGEEWKSDLTAAQKKVDDANRELDLLQREYRLRAAVMYADAGNRMRNQASWDKEDADFKDKIAQKQKDAAEAKQQLEDLQEKARKAGVASSSSE